MKSACDKIVNGKLKITKKLFYNTGIKYWVGMILQRLYTNNDNAFCHLLFCTILLSKPFMYIDILHNVMGLKW